MKKPLRILMAEDNCVDADLVLRELRRAGFEPLCQRVDTEAGFAASLSADLDVVLSDYDMPQFSGPRALEMLQERGLEIPFIIISGTIGEDIAVDVMKLGASDYLLKDRLARLGQAITHATEKGRMLRERKQARAALRKSEERFRQLAENIQDVFWLTDVAKHRMLYVSPAYETIWGRTCADLYASPRTWLDAIHPDDRERVLHAAVTKQTTGDYDEEYRIVRPDGSERWIRDRAFPVANAAGEVDRVVGVARDVTERKKAGEELQLFRNLVDQSDDTFEVIDPATGRFLDVNAKGPAELGCSRAEYLSMRVCDVDPTVTEAGWPPLADMIRAAGSLRGEGCHRRKDGTTFPIEFSAKWVRLDRDYIVTTVRDITERNRAEEHVREQAAMLDHAHDAIVVRGFHDRRISYWNYGAEILYGWTAAEAAGRDIGELICVDPARPDEIGDELLTSDEWHGEAHHKTKDGKQLIVNMGATLMRDAAGQPKAVLSINTDITERKRLELESREREAMLTNAQRFGRMGTWALDLHSGHLAWSKETCELFGISPGEFTGNYAHFYSFILPEDRPDVDATHGPASPGRPTIEAEYRIRRPDGEVRWMYERGNIEFDAAGKQIRRLGMVMDITERKKLEEQLLRAQRMESIGTLAGGIAHDLNNVLGPIMMSLDLLKLRFPEPENQELLSIVGSSAQRGADMVRQVLSFARGMEGRRMEVQVKHLIRDIEKIVGDTFVKNIQVRTNVPHDLWTVVGDPTQLHQVLLNLCVNARDAMPDGGLLTLSAENRRIDEQYAGFNFEAKPGPYVYVQVEDSGTGMPPEILGKIFEPFFTTKEIGKGTGLGLSTSMAIVKSHGGFMQVYSELEKGTKFRIYLPAQIEPLLGAAAEAAVEMPCGHGELILVVDDEASVRQITQQTLEAFGYGVVLACDGAEAVAAYAAHGAEIAAVITDMMMPVMDGIATIRVLRKMNPAVRIIGASGLSASGYATQAATLGVKHFLPKPYTSDVMLKALREVLADG